MPININNRDDFSIKDILNFSIINIDKPSGPTSFDVSQFVKRALGVNKTSHFGTLDPAVTGVLPVGLGRACRLSDYFMHKDKTYVGIMRLHEEVADAKLKEIIETFIGTITQLPPVRSRVKRAEREREIKTFKILERDGTDVVFEACVQAGTYIRKLIHDMGELLGGAHMLELRRTKAGMFDESSAVTLYQLESALAALKDGNEAPLHEMLVDATAAIKEVLPVVQAKKESKVALLRGKPLMKHDLETESEDETFAVFIGKEFIGTYHRVDEKDIIARAEFVYN